VKGAIVGLQWQTGMHGFEHSKKRRLADSQVGQDHGALPKAI
jgi:hypothetical protein